ncbi:MAG TPA: RraA family protein [Tepidisphaeraceae bacterium]|nr:RraA family protein [Tepidisphaeraceae bacterium]
MSESKAETPPLSLGELLELGRWNTPTIYNGWERITRHDSVRDGFNLEPAHDFMPALGPMVGYAVTLVVELSNPMHAQQRPEAFFEFLESLSASGLPGILVVQDLDKPRCFGSALGEVFGTIARSFGCVGAIVDGGLRDIDEMARVGFKAIGRQLCVGHGAGGLVRWNCPVEVFGRTVRPGQLIHADKHGFLAIPFGEERGLLEAARRMDSAECNTFLSVARASAGKPARQIIAELRAARDEFRRRAMRDSCEHARKSPGIEW